MIVDNSALFGCALATLVVVVVPNFDVLKDTQGIVCQDGAREVESQQIRSDTEAIQSHEPRGQARHDLAWNAGLVQPDNALVFLADSQEQNTCCAKPLV